MDENKDMINNNEDVENIEQVINNEEEQKEEVEKEYHEEKVGASEEIEVTINKEDENSEENKKNTYSTSSVYDNQPVKKNKTGKVVLAIIGGAILFGIIAGPVMSITSKIFNDNQYFNGIIKTTKDGFNGLTNNKNNEEIILDKAESEDGENRPKYSIEEIAEICMPSIVSITNKGVTEVMTFFGPYAQESTSSGSGIIIGQNDDEILIVTNYHVVADSQELSVIFSDEEVKFDETASKDNHVEKEDILQARVKGYDSDKDLAVISIKTSDVTKERLDKIKIATIGDSSKVKLGEQVVAIGNALGYGQSVTTGIVSATNRAVTLENQTGYGTVTNRFIQTDAAINPGNSGGALLNMRGELIGINSVKIASGSVEGIGYAIPISDVESIIGELMNKEIRDKVKEDNQGYMGITGENVNESASNAYGMPVGVFVSSVEKNSAAEKAGIKKGYIITKFDSNKVTSIQELQELLKYYRGGETKTVTVQVPNDGGYDEKELEITLGYRKDIDD